MGTGGSDRNRREPEAQGNCALQARGERAGDGFPAESRADGMQGNQLGGGRSFRDGQEGHGKARQTDGDIQGQQTGRMGLVILWQLAMNADGKLNETNARGIICTMKKK